MRIARVDLLRYGHFTDHRFALPVQPVDFHIVFGPNEAGKSTALAAIEDLLFGIPSRSPYNFRHDNKSMRIGALLENIDTSSEVVRRKGNKDTLLSPDDLPVPGGDSVLRPFLAGADRSFFERMFSLDHARLEAGGKAILEAKDEIGQMLFSAGAGIGQLRERLASLSDEADGIWASRKAQTRTYYQAKERYDVAHKELQGRTLSASKWVELRKALDQAEADYRAVQAGLETATAEGRRLARIRRTHRWVRRKFELDTNIGSLGEVIQLPEDSAALLDESVRLESDAAARIDTLRGQSSTAKDVVEESSPFLVETLHGSRWVMQPSSSISSTSSPQFSALAGGLRGALEDDGSRSPSSGAVRCR